MAESKVKEGNYLTIQSFMVTDLQLKGNELITYAIIYGFSQNGTDRFTGSLQYICDWTNSTKQGVIKVLKSLVSKGLIGKTEVLKNGVKFVEYYATEFTTIQQSLIPNETKFNGGMQQSLPNNINKQTNKNNSRKKVSNCYDNIIYEYTHDEETIEAIFDYVRFFNAKQGRYILNKELKTFLDNLSSMGALNAWQIKGCIANGEIEIAFIENYYELEK